MQLRTGAAAGTAAAAIAAGAHATIAAMPTMVNIDGRLAGERDAVVSVFDHGFLFGEGVYEVLRTYGSARSSTSRTCAGCAPRRTASRCRLPSTDDEMRERIATTIDAAPLPGEAYIRILLTRGVGEIVYDPAACPSPTIVVIVKPHVEPPARRATPTA